MAHRFGGTCPSPCVGMRPWSVGRFCGTDVFRKCPGVSSGTVQNVGDKVGDENRNKNLSLNNNFLYFYFRYSWSTSTTTSGKSCSPINMPASRGSRERPG